MKSSTIKDIFNGKYFMINKFFLSFIGLWPYQAPFKRILRSIIAGIGMIVLFVPMLLFIFKHSDDVDGLFELAPIMVGTLLAATKFFSILFNFKKFKILLQEIHDDWTNISGEVKQIFIKYAEVTRKFVAVYAFSVIGFMTCLALLAFTNQLLDIVLPLNVTRPRKLAHPAEFFVDQEKYYYILLTSIYFGYVISMAVISGIDTIYFIAVEHTCTLFNLLCYQLENTGRSRSESDVNHDFSLKQNDVIRHLIRCIRLHIKIKRFMELIETTFMIFLLFDVSLGFLMHYTLCIMMVLQIGHTIEIWYFALMAFQSGRLFLHGWTGQQIANHSSKVQIAAYNGAWYELSNMSKKLLLILFTESQIISEIKVGKSFVVNMKSFSTIMKTSISYCTVILSIYEEVNGA